MPVDLKELMRHRDIKTTMKYYVGINAKSVADTLWAAAEARIGTPPHTGGSTTGTAGRETQETL